MSLLYYFTVQNNVRKSFVIIFTMDDFFSFVSKWIIFAPIAIIIIAFVIKFNQKNAPLTSTINLPKSTITQTQTINNRLKINLQGPWVCRFNNNNQKYVLYIKNRKISLKTEINSITKTIDLSFYAGILESFLNYDVTKLESMAKPYLPKGVEFKTLINSCKKEEF